MEALFVLHYSEQSVKREKTMNEKIKKKHQVKQQLHGNRRYLLLLFHRIEP